MRRTAPKEPRSRLTEMGQESRTLPQRQRQRAVGELTQLTSWMGKTSGQNKTNSGNGNPASRLICSQMRNNAALVGGNRRGSRDQVTMLNNHRICQFDGGAIGFKSRDESPIRLDQCTSDPLIDTAEVSRVPPGCRQHPLRNQGKKQHPKHQLLEEKEEDGEDQQIIIPKLLTLDRLSKLDRKSPPRAKQQLSKPSQPRPLPPRKQQNNLLLPAKKQCSQQGQKYKKQHNNDYFRDFYDPISTDAESVPSDATRDNSETPSGDQHQLSPKQIIIFKPTATTNSGTHSLRKLRKQFAQLSKELAAVCGSPLCGSPIFTEKDESDLKHKVTWDSNRDGSRDFADEMLQTPHHALSQPRLSQPLPPQQLSQTSILESESLMSPPTVSLKQLCYPSLQPLAGKQPDPLCSRPSTQSPPESESVPLINSALSYHKLSPQLPSQSLSEPLPKPQSPYCKTTNSRQKTMPTTVEESPTCEDNNSLESECSTLKRQELHIVDGLMSFQQFQEQLCTSSSNCCGGNKRNKSSEMSPDSSLNLVSGTSTLSRPGSLCFLNIDGLTARRMRCAHEELKNGDLEYKENKELKVNLRRKSEPRSSKKRVSFSSACINTEDNATEGQLSSVATCTSAVSMDTIQEDFTFELMKTDTDVSELDSDAYTRELSGNKSVDLKVSSNVGTMPVASLSTPVPPPVPPHAIGSKVQNERIVKEKTARIQETLLTSNLAEKAKKRFWADRTYILRKADAQLLSEDSNDSRADFATSEAFGALNADSKSQEVASNYSLPTVSNWKSVTNSSSPNQTSAVGKQAWNESNSADFGLLNKKPEGGKRFIEISVRQLNPQNNSGHFQDSTDTKTISSQLGSHISGSNCANSSIGLRRHVDRNQNRHSHGHYSTRAHRHGPAAMAAVNAPTLACTGAQVHGRPSTSPTKANCNESSYVVFNHPPEVSTAAKSTRCYSSLRGSSARVSDTRLDELPEENCSESIAFSWVTTLENDSNAVDLSMSLNGLMPNHSLPMSSRRNNSAGCTHDYCHTGKVKFNQLNTVEDCLTSIKTAAPTNARIADVSSRDQLLLKPSAVRDSATMFSVAKCVTRSDSGEQAYSSEFSESDSDHTFLMLETLTCGHKDHEQNKCSISCRSYTPPNLRPESRATATATSLPAKVAASASTVCRQKPAFKLPTAAPPPQQPPPSVPRAKSRSSAPAPSVASMSAVSQVSAAADAVRDLLARACDDPAEATALTQALVRGLVCNVESLRSALAATLLLLKDRRSVTGPLAQAIGTAKALDELIRQFQDSQQQQHYKEKQNNQHKKSRCSATSSDEDKNSFLEKALEKNAGHVDKTHSQSTAAGCKRRNSLSRCSATSHETVQCHAMAHYTVGDEFVVPSLEQRPSLECRPATTRVVRTESKAVNLAGDGKRRGH